MKAFPCPPLPLTQRVSHKMLKQNLDLTQGLIFLTRGSGGRKEVLKSSRRKVEPFLFSQPLSKPFQPPLRALVPSVKQRC